jgi:hypothetical protein
MAIQYLSDNLGNKTAVVIPIQDWQNITKKYNDLENVLTPANSNLKNNNKNSLEEELTPEAFLNWIEAAEKSPKMSLETFNLKWEQKKEAIQKLIL